MANIIAALKNPPIPPFFKDWFSTEVDKGIARLSTTELGREVRRRAMIQEFKKIINDPLILIGGIVLLVVIMFRR